MRVLLASAPHADTFGYSMPPPGLLRLGGELVRRDLEVELDDLAHRLATGELDGGDALASSAAERLLARAPGVLGLSTMGATLPIALAIAARVREAAPETAILLGGPGVGGIDRELVARFPFVDAVVRGEGERTLPALLEHLVAGSAPHGVAGVTWRDAGGRVRREADRPPIADLGELPPYAWELLPPIAAYKAVTGEAEGLVPVDSGRGCVYDCSFCSIGRFWGRRSRPLPAARLADEIAAIAAMPGGRNAYLCHDLFGADRAHALALCDELEARGARVPFEVRARVDHLDRELCERLARAGCYRVLFGVESGDAGVRAQLDKRMRADFDVLAAIDACARAGITPILSFVLGLPGEGDAELARTLELAAAAGLRAGVQLSLHLPNPQPGCRLGDEHAENARPVDGIQPDMAFGAGTTREERALVDAHPDLFGTFALLTDTPGGVARLRELHALATELPELLMRYPRTFAVVARRLGRDALGAWRALRAEVRSFEATARRMRDPLVDELLAWEQALVRASVRPSVDGSPPDASRGPRARAECLRADHDLPAVASALAAGGDPFDVPRAPTHLAIAPGARGVRTLRVSGDVAALLGRLDGRAAAQDLGLDEPAFDDAVARLAAAGLVETG